MFTPITAHIEIDRAQKRVRKDGQDIHLTSLEFGLLEYLCTHPNKLCSRDELIEQVWGERFLYDPGTIDLSAFLTTWLANHEAEIRDAGLTPLALEINGTISELIVPIQA